MLPPHDYWEQGNSAGAYTSPVDKFLIHTTEGTSIEGAVSAYKKNNSWPHLTVDCRFGNPYRRCGHLDLNIAARSLKNKSGGVETNTDGVIQVEVVGSATAPHAIDWIWLSHNVIEPICGPLGIPCASTVTWWPYPESYGNTAVRLSPAGWTNYTGLLGHQHAPENDHGDPGAIPIAAMLTALKPVPPHARSGSKVLDTTTHPDGDRIDMVGIGPDHRLWHYTGTTVDGFREATGNVIPECQARSVSIAWVDGQLVVTMLGLEMNDAGDGIAVWTVSHDGTAWTPPVPAPAAMLIDPAKV